VPALDHVRPRYGQASLAEVLPSVLSVLGVPGERDALGLGAALDGVRHIAVLLVDGLGWHQLGLAATSAPTLTEMIGGRLGSARSLTSGFPSTTPTSLVTLGTGAPPGAHGVVGFTVNIPGTNRVLNHIRWEAEPDPRHWQPLPTAFDRAAAAGMTGVVVTQPEFANSGLSVSAYRGAEFRGATLIDDVAAEMLAALRVWPLVYGYHADLDRMGHLCGVDSEPWRFAAAEVDRLLTLLVDGLQPGSALIVTADHGQLDVPLECRFDVDSDARLRFGVRVVAGEARVRYLHTEPGARDDVIATWRGVLGRAARVLSREEAVAEGWFGPVPEAHLARVGDVVVACHDRYAVLATKTEPEIASQLVAYHGSYTAAEMQIPLLVIRA
jgi:hypothetical protein